MTEVNAEAPEPFERAGKQSLAVGQAAGRKQVVSWALWDWGSSAFHAVILTFVFSVYLVKEVGDDLPGRISPGAWLGFALGISGFVVAVTAPVAGQWFDASAKRKLSLAVLTGITILAMAALFFVRDDHRYLWLGLALLALGSAAFELSNVPYNAMLRQVSTPATVGRVSGFGWAMGYFGGIFLLLACYLGFISGDGDHRGLLSVPTADGLNIRLVAVLAAVWFALFALPVLFAVPELPRTKADPGAARAGFFASYKVLWRDLKELWVVDRRTVGFLIASAIFRDGLAGVFTFGAVLAVQVYGFTDARVLLFGIAANVVAALGAIIAGRFDDRLGPKIVIVISLASMLVWGTVLLFVSGPLMFWIFGLLLTISVGPAQASARSFLTRLAPPGREGQYFGLYTTTGRAASFLAPTLFGVFVAVFGGDQEGAERVGIVGLLLVLGVGLVALLAVSPPDRTPAGQPVDAVG
ncbi:MFS transporter [Nocardia sp. XZ_19_385]|uniref:MFS transporter n=1 Tax=Nocardia sp. XZ_19_385 TaxID=2769488 RepID=UPI00188EF160|nr:MFS transporter [Nocardia sp. XZ_19_385]